MGWSGTVVVLPLLEGAGQARFGPPAPYISRAVRTRLFGGNSVPRVVEPFLSGEKDRV